MKKNKKKTARTPSAARSLTMLGMFLRHTHSAPHKHRAAERGGNKNLQVRYQNDE